MYQDKILICKDCGREFIWTAGEQEFFAEKGFANEPIRCKACREANKRDNSPLRTSREMYDAVCATCGRPCKVPFKPTGDRPVYCGECFAKLKVSAAK